MNTQNYVRHLVTGQLPQIWAASAITMTAALSQSTRQEPRLLSHNVTYIQLCSDTVLSTAKPQELEQLVCEKCLANVLWQ